MKSYGKRKPTQLAQKSQNTQQISELPPQVNLNLDNFIVQQQIMLSYEDEDFLQHFHNRCKDSNPTEEILLEFLKNRFQGVCCKNVYIKSIKGITARTKIRIKDLRDGDITYQCDCLTTVDTIVVEPFSVLNFEVQSCSRQNDRTEIMGRRGEIKIFIDDGKAQNISQGMIIPCVVYDSVYSSGKGFIAAFGGIFRATPILQKYRITSKSSQSGAILEQQSVKIDSLVQNMKKSQKLSSPEHLQQVVQMLTGQPADRKYCQLASTSVQSSVARVIQNAPGKCVVMDLAAFITGNLSISDASDQMAQEITGTDQEILFQILSAMEKWMTFYSEFSVVLENSNNSKVIGQLLSTENNADSQTNQRHR